MFYSCFSIFALIIIFIINFDILQIKKGESKSDTISVYKQFLNCFIFFLLTDIAWGILYELKFRSLVYIDTILYFLGIGLLLLCWEKYVTSYLNSKPKIKHKLLVFSNLCFLVFVCVLIINLFFPILFQLSPDCVYTPLPGRYIFLILQLFLFTFFAFYAYTASYKTSGPIKIRYRTLSSFGIVMSATIIAQTIYPFLPAYSVGSLIGFALLHTFVFENEKEEQRIKMEQLLADNELKTKELSSAMHMALTDPLTHVKNKHAYLAAEDDFNEKIKKDKENLKFAVVVFDLNGLKNINDTLGHEAGDEYIKNAARTICKGFKNSPVYRIGGDEFATILEEKEFENKEKLLSDFRRAATDKKSNEITIASGISNYDPKEDNNFQDVFIKADKDMYIQKREIKIQEYNNAIKQYTQGENDVIEGYKFDNSNRLLMETSKIPFAIFQFIKKQVIPIVLSDGFCDLFGYSEKSEAYLDMTMNKYKNTHPDDVGKVQAEAIRFATDDGKYEVVYRSKNNLDGLYHIIHSQGLHTFTKTGVRLAHIWYTDEGIWDEETKTVNAVIPNLEFENDSYANYFDFLTGIPSMTYFMNLAEENRKRLRNSGKTPVFLYLDLSGMKFYNHKYGFDKGDELLRSFANNLSDCFGNTNCGYFGQDHFVVFSEEKNCDDNLKKLLTKWENLKDEDKLPVKIGVYKDIDPEMPVATACDCAKIASDSIRTKYATDIEFFNETLKVDIEKKRYIIDNLEKAISEKWLQVYYQPIIRASNGKICDDECLVRWIDPEKGFLVPDYFISTLEEAGLIYKLDLYVLEQALETMKILKDKGFHVVPHSINLSRVDFEACDIVEEVRKRVDASEFSRDMITIEITESILASDYEFMKEQIERFRKLGFPVWMDDFGSGYSSLDILQSVPFDLIKFDMKFMKQFDEGNKGKIILTELMRMSIGIDTETVCEGVETEEQVEFLREIGCVKMQGYYFEKPIPFEKMLTKYEESIQADVEDPAETKYYDLIGRISLYDAGMIANDNDDIGHYFDTIPMAIFEIKNHNVRMSRCNNSFKKFGANIIEAQDKMESHEFFQPEGRGAVFQKAIEKCCAERDRTVFTDILPDGKSCHTFIRWIAQNPKGDADAVAVAILTVEDESKETMYASIAKALAGDYFNLFYVNIEEETFIEYTSDLNNQNKEIVFEQQGENFFEKARQDATLYINDNERPDFLKIFTKENVLNNIEKSGSFSTSYTLKMDDGSQIHASMKAVMMEDNKHIIIGVRNNEAEIKNKEIVGLIKQEQKLYRRLTALVSDYIVIYTVDMETDKYIECASIKEFSEFEIANEGEDFFKKCKENGRKIVHPDDYQMYKKYFTKKNICKEIKKNGNFKLNYRIIIDNSVQEIEAIASIIEEDNKEKMIVGIKKT